MTEAREPAGGAIHVSASVARALAAGQPVVALESSVFAQGLPEPANREARDRMVRAITRHGAVPAITAVARGRLVVGLEGADLERFLARDGIVKVAARDLAAAATLGADGATTVSASLVLAARAGIRVFATGGIGGVHRDAPFDESSDLIELSRNPVVCVCAGAKAILDLRATSERLETLSIPVVGFGTDWLPEFYNSGATIPAAWCVDSPEQVARLFERHRALGMPGAVLVGNPPPEGERLAADVIAAAIETALSDLRKSGVAGKEVTPALLASVERATAGKSVAINVALLESNADLAARIAVALAAPEKNR
ncbi:MAG: pseudouridine-5'-phosphate glycosidase [Gemmatimonadaceae bacterium]